MNGIVENKKIILPNNRLLQVGALVYKFNNNKLEILLITSRDTGRWIIPKGWPMVGRTLSQAALREAYEESGVRGAADTTPIGRYDYEKYDAPQDSRHLSVDVFSVFYSHQEKKWPERGQRIFEWVSCKEGAKRVAESGLKQILLSFSPQ